MWQSLWRFIGKRIRKDSPLVEFEDGLLLIVDAEQLTHNLHSKLQQFLDVEAAAVYLADAGGTAWTFHRVEGAGEGAGNLPDIAADSRMANWFRVNREILWFDPGHAVTQYLGSELQVFLEAGMQLALPLVSMDRLIGLVFLRLRHAPLSEAQLANVQVLSRQAGLAFENALLFKERLRQNERMYRAEQLALMGQFAVGIAHELRNPLTAIRSTVQFLAEEFEPGSEPRKLAAAMLDEVDRLNGTVGDLLSLGRPTESKPVVVDLRDEIDKCTAFVEARARSQGVQVEVCCAEGRPRLFIDPAELRQVLLNIMINGFQAMPSGGTLRLRVQYPYEMTHTLSSPKDKILLEISDEGPGIPEGLREKVFEPFFTTKAGGTGLGLPICRSIVRRYDGEIWIEAGATGGTSVRILLPGE